VYNWRVQTALPEGDYVIRIRHVETELLDYSDPHFSVIKPLLEVSYPNMAGESLARGQTHTIRWDIQAPGVDVVVISLMVEGNKWFKHIGTADNTGVGT
jgi:hypothetical protein